MQVAPEYPAGSGGAVDALRAGAGRQAGAALGRRHDAAERRAAVDQPHRPAAVGHAVVQPRSRASRSATRWRASSSWRARRCPATVVRQLPGHGAGVPGVDARPRLGPRAGDLRHLRRARHPLRELHPPADDSLGPAVGRLRRAADAADLQAGPEHLRVRRHHHAGRPREEERHHDDRLRDRGAARAARSARPTRSTRRASSASGRS